VKDDHFFDAGCFDLSSTTTQLGQMRVADRTVDEAAELQMDEAVRVGELDRLTGDGFQSCCRNKIASYHSSSTRSVSNDRDRSR